MPPCIASASEGYQFLAGGMHNMTMISNNGIENGINSSEEQ
jgi:hypothetical protein